MRLIAPANEALTTLRELPVMKAPSAAPRITTYSEACHSYNRLPPAIRKPTITVTRTTMEPNSAIMGIIID